MGSIVLKKTLDDRLRIFLKKNYLIPLKLLIEFMFLLQSFEEVSLVDARYSCIKVDKVTFR